VSRQSGTKRRDTTIDGWDAACVKAETTIVRQVVDALEQARLSTQQKVTDVASKARVSPRMFRYIRSGQARPSFRTLLALCEAHGCELDIRVRAKRKVEEAQVQNSGRQTDVG
jgi:hypothetical protein